MKDRRKNFTQVDRGADPTSALSIRPARGSLREIPVPPPVRDGGDAVEELLREREDRL